jgi:hypothetical protein
MKSAQEIFASVPSASVGWREMLAAPGASRLNPGQPSLAGVFSKYFETFDYCVESTKVFFKSWNIYQPVRTLVSDLPDFHDGQKTSLGSVRSPRREAILATLRVLVWLE